MGTPPKLTPNVPVNRLGRLYRSAGFTKTYTFSLWLVLGGVLVAFSCARLKFLDFRVLCPQGSDRGGFGGAVPGECYYFEKAIGRAGILMHLAGILPASILVVFQFVPAIRQRFLVFHRISGYIIVLLSTVSMVGVIMIAKPTFGGTLDMQTATGTSTIIFLTSQGLGYYHIKNLQLDQHRAWMLRGWVIVSFIITMRIVSILMATITSVSDSYYTIGPCAVIDYIYFHNQTTVEAYYPECTKFYTGEAPSQLVLVKADFSSTRPEQKASGLNASFGAGAWLALAIHCVAVEVYLHLTPGEAKRLRRVSHRRQLDAGRKSSGHGSLAARKLGDAGSWPCKGYRGEVCRQAAPETDGK